MSDLVEHCQKININDLLKGIKAEWIKTQLQNKIEASGQQLQITATPCHFGGYRYWFVCPSCNRRSGTLYQKAADGPLLCRNCQDLTYLKSRYNKMI